MKSSDVSVDQQFDASQYNDLRDDLLSWSAGSETEVTISSGSITFTSGKTLYTVDTEGDAAADDLDSISGGSEGNIVILFAENTSRVVTVKDGSNIRLGDDSDFDLDDAQKNIVLIKTSAGHWQEITRTKAVGGGFDSGLILLFDDSCPAGWTRFSALDDSYPRGAASYGGTGGTTSHNHTLADVPAHTHTGSSNLQGDSTGAHTHQCWLRSSTGGSTAGRGCRSNTPANITSSYNGAHSHTLSGNLDNAGTSGASSDNATGVEPPYLDMIFCKKD